MRRRVFHQNLMHYGGSMPRTEAFAAKYRHWICPPPISPTGVREPPRPPIVVAGFTEVMSVGAAGGLSSLAAALMPGGGPVERKIFLISVGVSAIAGQREYIGIATSRQFQTELYGVAYKNHLHNRWYAAAWQPSPRWWDTWPNVDHADADPQTDYLGSQPGSDILDQRGLAFVAGLDRTVEPPQRMIVAFMHSNYTTAFNATPQAALMIGKVRARCGGAYAGVPVLLGGDFNARPYLAPCASSAVDHDESLVAYAAQNHAGFLAVGPANTTLANPYDWWFCSGTEAALGTLSPSLEEQTRKRAEEPVSMVYSEYRDYLPDRDRNDTALRLSDHAAVLLEFGGTDYSAKRKVRDHDAEEPKEQGSDKRPLVDKTL